MTVIKKIGNILTNIFFIIAIIVIIAGVLCAVFHYRPSVVVSGSMEPEIPTGSLVFIDTDDREPAVGDIIAFHKDDVRVTHRVVEITEQGYVTKGDNNDSVDVGVVLPSQVDGTTVITIPVLGYIVKTLVTLPALIIIVTLLICWFLIKKLFVKKDDEETKWESFKYME